MKALLQKRLSLRDLTQTTFGSLGNSEVEIGRFTYGIDSANILQWGEGETTFRDLLLNRTWSYLFLGGNHRADWATTYPFCHIFTEVLGGEGIIGIQRHAVMSKLAMMCGLATAQRFFPESRSAMGRSFLQMLICRKMFGHMRLLVATPPDS